jgi:hypothetical protein
MSQIYLLELVANCNLYSKNSKPSEWIHYATGKFQLIDFCANLLKSDDDFPAFTVKNLKISVFTEKETNGFLFLNGSISLEAGITLVDFNDLIKSKASYEELCAFLLKVFNAI